jgi:hypothetical protein
VSGVIAGMSPEELEIDYQKYIGDLKQYAPDGIVEIDLSLLHELGLLACVEDEENEESGLTHNFYVIESADKLTLFNQKYVIWIVPKLVDQTPTTYTLIALNDKKQTHLEMVFSTSGVYNHSSLVLRILEKFLEQIEENEEEICKYRI